MEPCDTASPVRIMIVDDHPNTATMLARVLNKFETPVEVLTASSGEEAVHRIGERAVDILITDFMMPGLNGLELIERLKGEQKPAHTILITAYDTPGLAITARRLNVQDYLVKPVQPEKIRGIVARVLDDLRPTKSLVAMRVKQPFKILIADDYPDNVRLLSTRLQSEGYHFISAGDGEEALLKTHQEDPDLVLLDVNMPKKDGFQVLSEMRADMRISHIPVIIITAARIGPKDIRDGLTLGADDYIIKPFDWRELAARIQSKLRVKQAEDVLRRRTRELLILPEIGRELSARLDIEELANTILNRTVETLEASSARLEVFQPNGEVFCRARRIEEAAPACEVSSRAQVLAYGLGGHVVATRQATIVENVGCDDRWRGNPDHPVASAVGVPLLGRHGVIGVLTLTHDQPAYFTEEHQTLLQAIASQAAIAVENAQLFNIEHKRAQELMSLNKITHQINCFTHSRELFDGLPGLVRELFGYPVVAIWDGLATGAKELTLVSMAGSESMAGTNGFKSAPEHVAACGTALVSSDPTHAQSVAAVPISLDEKLRGVIAIYSPASGAFQESDCVLLETLATQVASALERIELFESVEQEQRRLLAVLRSAADAILVIDAQLRLTLANPAGERLFSDAESHVGQPLPCGQGYDRLIELLNQARSSGLHHQGEVEWPDGRTFSVLVTPIDEGGQVAVLHDVSHFKALTQLKNEYIATASHDLKNPIMAVLGYNDLLSKAGPLNPLQEDFSKRIHGSAMQMRDLVLNLLEISRLESGAAMKQEELDLHNLLKDAVQELEDQAQAKSQTLSIEFCEAQPRVIGDPTLLQQMVRNLLGNAIKYTPQDGQITISTQIECEQVCVTFRDTGYGIPPEDLPFIFNKFFRAQSKATQDIEGNGLGLAIVKSIAENHGGQVSVASKMGEGSTFKVNLPLLSMARVEA